MDIEAEKKSEAFLENVHKNVLISVSEAPWVHIPLNFFLVVKHAGLKKSKS